MLGYAIVAIFLIMRGSRGESVTKATWAERSWARP